MTLTLPRPYLWFFVFAFGIVSGAFFLVQSPAFLTDAHWLSLGITVDIAVGIPLLYYLLVVRRQAANWITTLVVFLIAVGVAHAILPEDQQYFLSFAERSLIITESIIVLYGLSRIRKILAAYRAAAQSSPDVVQNLKNSLEQVLGSQRSTQLVVNEVATFYYGIFFWRLRPEVKEGQTTFTYHRESAYPAMIGALLLVTIAETIGLHLLLSRWSEALALGFTILSVYSFLFLWADLMAVLKRPIILDQGKLYLRIGLRWQATIPVDVVESVEPVPDTYTKSKSVLNVALLASPNAKITFRQPVTVQGIYGISKTVSAVALPIDSYQDFQQALLDQKNQST
ncbi:MAG: hypothetical protein AAF992_07825 [Bacteroidota bacterium]